MTAQPVQLRPMTAAEYAELPEDEDARYELQEGMRVVGPRPRPVHQDCLGELRTQISAQLSRMKVLIEVDIDLELTPPEQPGTVRVADLVVVSREAFDRVGVEGGFLRASEVLLAVEVLSPGSRRTDSRIKHDEYADAGIGHYWMIDLDDGPSLTACHLAGEFGYVDAAPVRGEFGTDTPCPLRIDLDGLA